MKPANNRKIALEWSGAGIDLRVNQAAPLRPSSTPSTKSSRSLGTVSVPSNSGSSSPATTVEAELLSLIEECVSETVGT
jgi:hypothetical protein